MSKLTPGDVIVNRVDGGNHSENYLIGKVDPHNGAQNPERPTACQFLRIFGYDSQRAPLYSQPSECIGDRFQNFFFNPGKDVSAPEEAVEPGLRLPPRFDQLHFEFVCPG